MGTKVQCKNYFGGYHTMRDLDEGASSSWSVYCDDMSPSGQIFNGFTPRPLNGYAECDKETLKQTMIKHDAIFRKQVCELHRLYKIQKNLMDDLKRKELCHYSVKVMTPQSLPFSSQNPCNGTERMWHLSRSSEVNANCSRPSVSAFDDMRYPLSLLQESTTQGSPRIPIENEGSTMDENLIGSRFRRFPGRMLDLQLPAEAYIDSEDTEPTHDKNAAELLFGATDSVNSNCDFEPENDVKLTLSTGDGPSCVEERWQSDSRLQNGPHARNLADLNEPVKEISCEEAAISAFSKCPGPTTPYEDMQGHQVSLKSKPSFLSPLKDFLQDRHRDEGTCSVLLHADEEEKRPEWSFFNNEPRPMRCNGESLTQSYNGNLPTSSEPPKLKPNKLHGLSSSDISNQHKTAAWFREKTAHGVENSGRSPLARTSYFGPTASPVPGALSDVSYSDCRNTGSSVVSSWRKTSNSTSHLPVAVQTLPYINGSAPRDVHSRGSSTSIQSHSNACEKWQYKRDCKLYQGHGSEASSYPNGFHHNLQSETNASSHLHFPSISFDKPNLNDGDKSACESLKGHDYLKYLKGLNCMDLKSAKDVNLNVALPNGFHDQSTPQQSLVSDVEGKYDHLFGKMSWLRTKLACSESNGAKQGVNPAESYSQTVDNYDAVAREFDRKRETGSSPCLVVLQDLPSALCDNDTRIQRNDTADNPSNKKILGFSIDDRTHLTTMSSTSTSCREHAVTDDAKGMKEGLCHTDSYCEIKLLDLEKQTSTDRCIGKSVGNRVACFRDKINLNSVATRADQLNSSEISSKDEADVPSPLPIASVTAKIASKIDLEAPLSSQAEEHVPFMGESLETNLRATPVETSRLETEGPPEIKSEHETIARVAAQTMVSISLDKCSCSDDITGRMLAPDLANSLNWFADVVTSNADDLEGPMSRREEDGAHGSSGEGVDYFESMTLKLRETKIEEYCRPWEWKDQEEDEETGVASMLLTRPRKGQARRRRQRRDFQKDILPGLVSLSRHEVTEDLQMIGGLMRASGQSWQTSVSRRNMGRNGGNSQARGRRRTRGGGSTAAIVENTLDPPPQPPQPKQCNNNTELEIDGRSIMGWGRTTRRCRRQRCPLGNATAPPLT